MARDNRIDSLKGLLIILVILGHVITTIDNVNIVNHAVMGFIYIFHMPLFILISGYLTKPPQQQSSGSLFRSLGNLLVTLIIFHIINSVTRYLVTGISVWTTLAHFPYGILWYLMCLIYWRLALYFTPRALLEKPILYLGIALIVSLLSGLTHLGHLLAIQRALNFYFFFFLGYYYKQGEINQRWWKSNTLHFASAIVLLPLIYWLFPRCGNFMNGADHYTLIDIPQKCMILTCSTALSILLFNLMREHKFLCHFGKESLFYYVYHIIIITLARPLFQIHNLPHTFPFILLYTLLVICIVYAMSRVKLFKWLMRPIRF